MRSAPTVCLAVTLLAGCGRRTTDAPTAPPPERQCDVSPTRDCFVRIPEGRFLQGAQATDPKAPGFDPHALPEESPVRERTVASFWLMRTEASAGAYENCVAAGACSDQEVATTGGYSTYRGGQPDLPITGVSWRGASDLCRWMGGRLTTETEWEYAARGPSSHAFPWGNKPFFLCCLISC